MLYSTLLSAVTVALVVSHSGWSVNAALTKRFNCGNGGVTANPACCALFPVVNKLQTELFDGGECGEDAHSALRLAFHDAIGFSVLGNKGGGADGSILAFNRTETAYHANGGTDDIVATQFPIFKETTLSAGDFVHLAAAVGVSNCAGAPRLSFFMGRSAPKAPAPDFTVPEPTDSVTTILARFADAGFSAGEVVALLASHSIAAADAIDPTIPGTPFDSTASTFDSQIFLEVLLKGTSFPGNGNQTGEVLSPLRGEMRLQSDFAISQDPRTACFWQAMIDQQLFMTASFKDAMRKLQLLGQIEATLIDCSDVIPIPAAFSGHIKYPASFSKKDLQIACPLLSFPSVATVAGPAPTVAPVYVQSSFGEWDSFTNEPYSPP